MRKTSLVALFCILPFVIAAVYERYGWAYGLASLLTLGLLWVGILTEMSILVDRQRAVMSAAKVANEAIAKAGATNGK